MQVVWARKVEEEVKGAASVECEGGWMVPAFDRSLGTIAPPLPKLPPVEVQTPKQQDDHLLSLLTQPTSINDYESTKKESYGGVKPGKRVLNLVNY